MFSYRNRGENQGIGKQYGGVGGRKKKRAISKAFVESSDEYQSEKESVGAEKAYDKRKDDESCEKLGIQDSAVMSSESALSDR